MRINRDGESDFSHHGWRIYLGVVSSNYYFTNFSTVDIHYIGSLRIIFLSSEKCRSNKFNCGVFIGIYKWVKKIIAIAHKEE